MLKIKNLENLHHAYIIEGDTKVVTLELLSFLEHELRVPAKGNPDFWHREFDAFGISDAHALKEIQTRKGVGGGKKFFVFSFLNITEEAQNALLKMFEEPTEGTHFFAITPSLARIVPTLLSRVVVISTAYAPKSGDISLEKMTEQFLRYSPSKRILLVQGIIKEKDKNAAREFLNSLDVALWQNSKNGRREDAVRGTKEVMQARKNLSTRSPSVKLILEHLSLVLPRA